MTSKKTLLIATSNAGKLSEFRNALAGLWLLRSLDEFPAIAEVDETGDTFLENARLKAKGYALATGLPAIADDSGLVVDALGGRPGVRSARYGGVSADFRAKIGLLLDELRDVPADGRTARFECSIAIANPAGHIVFDASGICEGAIAHAPAGENGFGYDPIFVPDGFDITFGQLSSSIKSEISHRARAIRQIIPFLRHFDAV